MQISVTSDEARKSFTPSTSYWYSRKSLLTEANAPSLISVSVPRDHAGEVDVLRDIDREDGALVDRDRRRTIRLTLHRLVGELLHRVGRIAFERALRHDTVADLGLARTMFGSLVLEGIAEQADQQGGADATAPVRVVVTRVTRSTQGIDARAG